MVNPAVCGDNDRVSERVTQSKDVEHTTGTGNKGRRQESEVDDDVWRQWQLCCCIAVDVVFVVVVVALKAPWQRLSSSQLRRGKEVRRREVMSQG